MPMLVLRLSLAGFLRDVPLSDWTADHAPSCFTALENVLCIGCLLPGVVGAVHGGDMVRD